MSEATSITEHSRRASRRAPRRVDEDGLTAIGSFDESTGFVRVPVIATKLQQPELPTVLVTSRRPVDALARGADVTLLVAAAGYGKTVAVRQWISTRCASPVAWFSLDALDRNPISFWRHLIAALDRVTGIGTEAELVLMDRGPDDAAFLHGLVHAMLQLDRPVVLVLDDLHQLGDRTALDHLALLVERTSGVMRLVATSRTQPGLPLSRWRLQQRIVEVTEADLRFDPDQAAALLHGYGCAPLGADDLSDAVRRSEGWAAGLQLAALARPDHVAEALRDRSDREGLITSYLVDEVVARLPERQRHAVATLSVLEEFDLSLAAGLTARNDIGEVLRDLHAGHVFLVRSGDATFRFHHLFRDVMRDELRTTDPVRWSDLQHRAAGLLASRGQVDAAFDHLMLVGDVDGAADLVLRPALDLSDRGWGTLFRSWLEQLPGDFGVHSAELMLDLAFAYFTAGRLDTARSWLGRAEQALGGDDPRVLSRSLMLALAEGDLDACAAAVSRTHPADAPAGTFERRIDMLIARANLLLGDPSSARAALDRAAAANPDDPVRDVTDLALRSRVLAVEGAVTEAEVVAIDSLARAKQLGFDNNPAVLEAHLGRVAAVLGRADVEAATLAVEALLDVVDLVDYPYSRAQAAAALLDLHGLQHGWAAVAGAFGDLCAQVGWTEGDPLGSIVAQRRVRAALAVGDLDAAVQAALAVRDPHEQRLAAAATLLADRRPADALQRLEGHAAWPGLHRVRAMIMVAKASPDAPAQRLVIDALGVAAPLGLAAPFVGVGDRIATMVAASPFELRRLLPALAGPTPERATGRLPSLVEPLTPRELDLLGLLPTHLSNAAMGERLYISVNTVKTNLKAIYRKMGTGSRAETVDLAQRMGLISVTVPT